MTDVRFVADALVRTVRGNAIEVRFVLPRGAYATTVLSNVLPIIDAAQDEQTVLTVVSPVATRQPEGPMTEE
jgi:hypothetical protein